MARRLASPQLRGHLKVDTIIPLQGKISVVGGVSFANGIKSNNYDINTSNSNPPKKGYTLRTSSAYQAKWKPKEVQSDDLPATGVISGNYYLPTINVDTKGRVVNAIENFVPPKPLALQAGTNVSYIISNKSLHLKTGKDTIQLILDLYLHLNPKSSLFYLKGLPYKLNTGIVSHFGGAIAVHTSKGVLCGLVEVHYPDVLVFNLPSSSEKVHLTGELVYQCENF